MQDKQESIIMYAHPACPMVGPVMSVLKQANADFEYINIFQDMEARQRVRDINDGYESVPTLVFPDGSTLTEPGAGELRKRLQTMGYNVPFTALITGNIWTLVWIFGLILLALRLLGVF